MADKSKVVFESGAEAFAAYRRLRIDKEQEPEKAKRELRRAKAALRRKIMNSCVEDTLTRVLNAALPDDEMLVWFWFNHFNVYWKKDLVGAALFDYVEQAIRPHVRGSFRAMLQATLTHPAMLVYLDNARNVAGHINENYARELLELHTLGVDGGYTQNDVQVLARMLTGVGLRAGRVSAIPAKLKPFLRQEGDFMFDPRKHEFGSRELLGHHITIEGFGGIEALLDVLVAHPATARHITGKLAVFLLGDVPPQENVSRAAAIFTATGGDLVKTMAALLSAANAPITRVPAFKDPYRYVISAVRLLRGGEKVANVRPVARWLTLLGQPLFGCRTPDGYSLVGADWISAGQMTQRFELASEMVHMVPRLLERPVKADEIWSGYGVRDLLTQLGEQSRQVLAKGDSAEQRLALLLSSPEFMFR